MGNAYSTTTNKFTCPIYGLYTFSITLENFSETQFFNGIIVVDDKRVGETTTGVGESNWDSSSITTVIECLEGEKVWVKSESSGDLDGAPSDPHTLFSGALISAH